MSGQLANVENRAFYVEDWNAAVAGDSTTTYLELLGKVFPDARRERGERIVARGAIRLRKLQSPKEITERKSPVEISFAQVLWIADEGEERLALLIKARNADAQGDAGEFNTLAIFRFQPTAQLIDAAEVDFDRSIDFWEDAPLLPIRQGETAFWLRATHHNSSEGFHTYFLTELRNDRLRLILNDSPGLTNVKLCGSERVETLKIERERGLFAEHRVFDLLVRSETQPTAGCEDEKPVKGGFKNRLYRLRWNARQQRYRMLILKQDRAGHVAR